MKKFTVKFVALLLAFVCLAVSPSVSALTIGDGLDMLIAQFEQGAGPETDGNVIDYRYFSPVGKDDVKKYPLVIWLHGMGDGSEDGKQVSKSEIAYWTSDEFQSRFAPAGGAFVLAARSLEEKGKFWDNDLIEPLKAAIDDFIAKNKKNIDLSRIYIGGYSMGGKMTLKMAVAYPEMFAAAFPICPAWAPSAEHIERLADMPVWLTSGTKDPLVNYYLIVTPTWMKICEKSNVAADCRFSTLSTVRYATGEKTPSSHHAWFAVNYDMFTTENGDYHDMTTVDGNGNTVDLKYPDGMISWLASHTSDYDGAPRTDIGTLYDGADANALLSWENITYFFKYLRNAIIDFFTF